MARLHGSPAEEQRGRAPFPRGRIERCLAQRQLKGAIVAVDFYQRTAVVQVSHELNARP